MNECGICWEPMGGLEAPCGWRGAYFHEGCMAQWCRRRARCPHCNADVAGGIVYQFVLAWMRASTESDCWCRGPIFLRMCDGMLIGANERSACESIASEFLLLLTEREPKVSVTWVHGMLCVAYPRSANREIVVRLCRSAELGDGDGRIACDGFSLMAVQRRVAGVRRQRRAVRWSPLT